MLTYYYRKRIKAILLLWENPHFPHSKFPPTIATKERMTKARLSLKLAAEQPLLRKVK